MQNKQITEFTIRYYFYYFIIFENIKTFVKVKGIMQE